MTEPVVPAKIPAQVPAKVPANSSAQKPKRLLLLVVIPLAFLVISLAFYMKGGRFVETDNAYVKADVLAISAEVSGAVKEVFVTANEEVSSNQLLFTLDSQPFQVTVDRAEAKLAQVRAELEALKASYREKEAQIELAKSNHAFAARDLARQKDLKGSNFISASTLDDLEHAVALEWQKLAVSKLALDRTAASLGGTVEQPLEQHPAYLAALADLREARLNRQRVQVRAPLPGVISKAPLPGQYVRAGNIVTALVATGELWIEANFTETDLTHVRTGQQVTVHVDVYPDFTWEGLVESISPATGAEFSIIPAQNATGNWVKVPQRVPVRVRLQPRSDAPALRAGFSAIVEIDTQHRRRLLGKSLQ